MNGIGTKVLQITLKEATKRQLLIAKELRKLPVQSPELYKLVAEQTKLIKETLEVLDRIT